MLIEDAASEMSQAGDLNDAAGPEPLLVFGVSGGLEVAREPASSRCECTQLRSGVNRHQTSLELAEPQPRSSTAWTQSRPLAVVPRPGSNTGTGVSSVWMFAAFRPLSRMRLNDRFEQRRGLTGPAGRRRVANPTRVA